MDFSLTTLGFSGVKIRESLNSVEKCMLDQEQSYCPIYHHFYPGLYMRELHAEKGVLLIGKYQKTRNTCLFLKGKAEFIDDSGNTKIMEAPIIFVAEKGQKIALVIEDMVFINIYTTDETDIEILEKTFMEESENLQESIQKEDKTEDIQDFKKILNEYNITEKEFNTFNNRTDDLIGFGEGIRRIAVFPSQIDGKGLFASTNIREDEVITQALINNQRTPAARYINHSKKPNAKYVETETGGDIVASIDIYGCQGGTKGQEITIDYSDIIKELSEALCLD